MNDRKQFREGVFARDDHKCVICKEDAVDAHHILERRLFKDGGYVLDNGASLCSDCHLKAEMTSISVEQILDACGIKKRVTPEHLYPDQRYDKWGNPILPNGSRLVGELFGDESVQKILGKAGVLDQFTHWVKYPRTHHLPWSQGTSDDRILQSISGFEGKRVIVTEKLDGENTTMYSDHIHARSVDGRSHPSQSWVKSLWAKSVAHNLPEGYRICGENVYAKHAIAYNKLETYFFGFSLWNDKNECESWETTQEWFELLGIKCVPVLYDGIWDEDRIRSCWSESEKDTKEGYVVRDADSFHYREFSSRVGKFVRPNHVQEANHWRYGNWSVNKLVGK